MAQKPSSEPSSVRVISLQPVVCVALMVAACYGAFFGLVVMGASGDPDSVATENENSAFRAGLAFLLASLAVFGLSAFSLKTRRTVPLVIAVVLSAALLAFYGGLTS